MDLSELQRWRKIVPAAMFCAVVWPIGHVVIGKFAKGMDVSDDSGMLSLFLSVVAIPLGVIYHALNWRRVVLNRVLTEFWQKIESQLRIVVQSSGRVRGELISAGDKRWKRIFYRQVDADTTVGEITKRVRDNGLALSSSADAILILGSGGLVAFAFALVQCRGDLAAWSIILLLFALLNFVLLRKIASIHQELVDEQLLHIISFRRTEIVDDYSRIVGQS